MEKQVYDILQLDKMSRNELDEIANGFGLDSSKWPKQKTIYSILSKQNNVLTARELSLKTQQNETL